MNRTMILLGLTLSTGAAFGQSLTEGEHGTARASARQPLASESNSSTPSPTSSAPASDQDGSRQGTAAASGPGATLVGPGNPIAPSTFCPPTIQDALGGACIPASNVPMIGHLLPLGQELFVDSNGRVGIGTTSPAQELHVVSVPRAVIRLSSWNPFAGDFNSSLELGNTDFDEGFLLQGKDAAFTIWSKRQTHGGSTLFGPHLTVLRQATTAVGIGTETPEARLDVAGDVIVRDTIEVRKPDGTVGILLDPDYGGHARIRTQVLEITGGADLAESFDTGGQAGEPGTVMIIDEERPGELAPSTRPYDARVAGVVSGAGGVRPGLHLGQKGQVDGETPVALTGRVYVRCNTETGPIRPGDRLTTSSTRGEAMRVADRERGVGAVIGKAMTSLDQGSGLVLVLVGLQ